MRPLSENVRKMVEDLEGTNLGGLLMLPGEKRKRVSAAVELILAIDKAGESSAVPYLCSYLFSPEKRIADAAANAVESLIGRMRPSALLQLDKHLRSGRWNMAVYLKGWDAIRLKDLARTVAADRHVGVIGLASFHRSGFIRESTLLKLATIHDGRELPFLLIRLADWVPKVRRVAEKAVKERIAEENVANFIETLPLLALVKNKERAAGGESRRELIKRITDFLQEPAHWQALIAGLRHKDQLVRRECLRLMRPKREAETTELLELISRDKDVINRRAALLFCKMLSGKNRLDWLRRLQIDRSPRIRRDALVALMDLVDDSDREKTLHGALMDSSVIVRQSARWHLEQLGLPINQRQLYTSALQSSKEALQSAAIAGLGEIGGADDANTVMPYLESNSVRVRKEVVRAIARLDGQAHVDLFLRLLADGSAGVSRTASRALEALIAHVSAATLWSVFSTSDHWHVKRNVVRLLNCTGKWDRISYLLTAATQSDLRLRESALWNGEAWAKEFTATWNYSKPNPEQRSRIIKAVEELGYELPPGLRKILGECQREWGTL